MSAQTDLLRNTLILGVGRLTSQFISFLLLPLYTFYLSPGQYGVIDLILTYVSLLAPLLTLQLDRAAFRNLIDARSDKLKASQVISNTLMIIVPIAIGVAVVCTVASYVVSVPYIALIAATIIANIFSNLFLQFARGLGKNNHFAIASTVGGLVMLLLTVYLLVILRLGIEGILWANILANASMAIYLLLALRLNRLIDIRAKNSEVQKQLISFSWPLIPSAVSWWFIKTFDRTIITIVLGAAANGIYAAANKYAMVFQAIYLIFDMSWTESASTHINTEGRDKFFSAVYNTSFRLFGSIGLTLIAVTPFVFNFIIGSEFQEAYLYIPIIILGVLLQAIVGQYSAIYIAKKDTKQVLLTSICAAIISVTVNLGLIRFIGIYAAALSSVLAFFVMAVWRHYDVKRYVTITFRGHIFTKLTGLYAAVFFMYYVNNSFLNVISLGIAIVASLALTQDLLTQAIIKLRSKLAIIQ